MGVGYHEEQSVASGELRLLVTVDRKEDGMIAVGIRHMDGEVRGKLVLHWGVVEDASSMRVYQKPPPEMLPENTKFRPGKSSVRTPFDDRTDGVLLGFPESVAPNGILFLVFVQQDNMHQERWFKKDNTGGDFYINLIPAISEKEKQQRLERLSQKDREEKERKEREEMAKIEEEKRQEQIRAEQEKKLAKEREEVETRKKVCREAADKLADLNGWELRDRKDYDFGNNQVYFISIKKKEQQDVTIPGKVYVVTNMTLGGGDLLLHWGLKFQRGRGWIEPPPESRPEGTIEKDGLAVQSKFHETEEHVRVVEIQGLPEGTIGIVAVLHAPPGQWFNKPGGGDMYVSVADTPPPPGLDMIESRICKEIAADVIEREMEYGSWTLMHRYNHGNHLVNDLIGHDVDAWGLMFVWMRYSQLRVLDWQRNYNTKPRELSHAQMNFVTCLARKYRQFSDLRWIIRLAMTCVGRGGSGDLGQKIRDDILVILRHNRGWGHGSMMEQWHQKLHNNTNPDDVIICDGLMAFWSSFGNIEEYRRVLRENGLTSQRLAGYEQPITVEPDYVPHIRDTMLHELGCYGHLLRQVHLGTDLFSCVDRVRGILDGDIRDKVNEYLHAREHRGLVDQVKILFSARESLRRQLLREGLHDDQARDLLFLDIALEADGRREIEGGKNHDGSVWSHLNMIANSALLLMLSEGSLPSSKHLQSLANELFQTIDRISYYGESEDAGLRAAAALSSARNVLTEVVDRYKARLGSLSEGLGQAFHASPETVNIFVEEVVRGGPAFSLSVMLRKAEPAIRNIAMLGPYSVISPYYEEVKGEVYVFEHLRECQALELRKNSVIVAGRCNGDEDVPDGCSYVIIGSTVDVLSHVAVRARNEHHGLIACFDEDKMEELKNLKGSVVKCKLEGEIFTYDFVEMSALSRSASSQALTPRHSRRASGLITPPTGLRSPRSGGPDKAKGMAKSTSSSTLRKIGREPSTLSDYLKSASWAIRPSEYTPLLVGSKSMNLARLEHLGLPDWILTPTSVTIPNGSLKKVFRDPQNEDLQRKYRDIRGEIYAAESTDVSKCVELRHCILDLKLPDGMANAIRGILDELGCEDIDASLPGAWEAIKGVWASLWNERAYLARRKMKMDSKDVDMAILCQKIIDADYAFVIHTANPISGDKDEIYGEIVIGLGETLVSNAPGQALGFVAKKDADPKPQLKSYPSKPFAMRGGEYIFRSDSNAEDLEDFAGAGLHDSIPIVPSVEIDIDYSTEQLMTDDKFRFNLMRDVARIGMAVEQSLDCGPQDIEGCMKDGKYYVVQARPQIL
eukprot:CAMPEP_0184687942 /NCGR_PEP_ID=MMETSP0312-20130426/28060_1 /TAXON_ID=31354 /ORGANISM="Compsopogon coeruleus, Strain SAG 36.94" /LENGTH=1305 /DNA_ID=CAMNT_0027144575 /DNA_START=67 /DNA_END=3984 /DNA_ORIENTATION=+